MAGAGIDVYAKEPCTASPLFAFDNVVATPHLGASTAEAQDKAGLAVARSVKLALQGEFVPDAVNVQAGGVVAEDVRPLLPLAEKLGQVFTAVAGGVAASVTVEVRGEIVANDVSGAQAGRHQGPVRLGGRGAGHLRQRAACSRPTAASRSTLATHAEIDRPPEPGHRPRRAARRPRRSAVSGTVPSAAPARSVKLTEVDGFDLELDAEGILLFFRYADRPAWSARSARSSARPASTSRRCRWPGARPAARR